MTPIKPFTVILLITAYAIGLLHESIPHVHSYMIGYADMMETTCLERSQRDDHLDSLESQTEHHEAPLHVQHRKHLDFGMFDLLSGLLGQAEHPDSQGPEWLHRTGPVLKYSDELPPTHIPFATRPCIADPIVRSHRPGSLPDPPLFTGAPPPRVSAHRGPPSVFV